MNPIPDTLGMVRASDPDTSREAADLVRRRLPIVRSNVLKVFAQVEHGLGLTDKELLDSYRGEFGDCPESTPRKRRVELVREGLVELYGVRTLPSGYRERTWRLKP